MIYDLLSCKTYEYKDWKWYDWEFIVKNQVEIIKDKKWLKMIYY